MGAETFTRCCATASPKRSDHRNRGYNARLFAMVTRSFILYANCTLFAISQSAAYARTVPAMIDARPIHVMHSGETRRDIFASVRNLPCRRSLYLDFDAHLVQPADAALAECSDKQICTLRPSAPQAGFIMGSKDAVHKAVSNWTGIVATSPWNRPRRHLYLSGMRF